MDKIEYTCTDCKYSYARMHCDTAIKDDCPGCPMKCEHAYSCKCTTHDKIGNECPDFELAEDNNEHQGSR